MSNLKLTHPESKITLDVSPEQAEMYQSQGWVEKSAAKKADDDKSEGK